MQPSYPTYDEESNPGIDAFLLPCFFWGKDEQRDDGAQRRGKAENNGETERISNSLAYGIYTDSQGRTSYVPFAQRALEERTLVERVCRIILY